MDKSIPISGISSQEAAAKIRISGYNELPSQRPPSTLQLLIGLLKEPMLSLLLITGVVYLLLGEPVDSLPLFAGILLVIGISLYQEKKTESALTALKQLSSPRALVIRDGVRVRIPGREVVVDDILIIREGDRVAADGIALRSQNLSLDESLLTGESLPVAKIANSRPSPPVFAGSLVVAGQGMIKVTAIGSGTQMGQIGRALATISDPPTLLKTDTDRVVRIFAIVGLLICLIVAVVYGLSTSNWLQGLLAGLTLGMSLLPEEFAVVLVVFLTLGAWRIAKHHVLTRNMSAIETLGAATALCVDKTGTLTQNRMELGKLWVINSSSTESDLVRAAALASHRDPFDPMEKAIQAKQGKFPDLSLVKDYPITNNLLVLGRAWKSPGGSSLEIAAKGAPEAIARLCRLSPAATAGLLQQTAELSSSGLRVLGVARVTLPDQSAPESLLDVSFTLVGLLGFADPVRPQVAEAVAKCYQAGIKVYMITGDYPGTAMHIASQIGLRSPDRVITGPDLDHLRLDDLSRWLQDTFIFARVIPQQKLLIINALKANHEIVAMTGDGVNDAPALKAAHIGIAMGERGTDVAREAADLVLLDDDFSSIVSAIKLGRRIYDNLKNAMGYIIAVHIPIAGLALLPLLFGFPLILLPAQIALLELIIDPACSLVFESEHSESDTMLRPPRKINVSLFDRPTVFMSVLQGLGVLVAVTFVFLYSHFSGLSVESTRTLTFITLVCGNLMLIASNLSRSRTIIRTVLTSSNRAFWVILLGTAVSLPLLVYQPLLRFVFHFAPLTPVYLIAAVLLGCLSLAWSEVLKLVKS